MRELIFELNYQSGWNPVADTLVEYSDATIRSLSCHVTSDNLWRVDHILGSPDALNAVETAYKTSDYFPDCLVTEDCEATSETQVLDRTEESLVIYCVWERSDICTSVPHLALEHFGEGLLFETRQEENRHVWRIILPGNEPIGSFADALRAEIDDIGGMELLRLTDHKPGAGGSATQASDDLSTEQRQALHAAVAHGYYETPRQIELTDLANELSIPQSTLSYRLQRAEAHLATNFVAADSSLDSLSTNQ
ncbi:helix-turn-helix domain-containing protein [Halorubrum vacuolatum]|uniref:HTH DNA binding domain-containing protein n=1 Tax=Halorubrum vacuolatum TaxID=63740 RepID=A0A238VLI8_HALVU|nr:helix-turn-helix domain-containing protein [Halorubrum vacuolatum]SNR35068.1 HTH DNA binding domain-containing protein [Halorubrum vacuolatum]